MGRYRTEQEERLYGPWCPWCRVGTPRYRPFPGMGGLESDGDADLDEEPSEDSDEESSSYNELEEWAS